MLVECSSGSPRLEVNEGDHGEGNATDSDGDREELEIPFLATEVAPLEELEKEVRLHREGDEQLGLVLDASNVVVMLREDTPASRSGQFEVGDHVVAVQGVEVNKERRVAMVLRELADAAVVVIRLRRAIRRKRYSDHLDHGPLMTADEILAAQTREADLRYEMCQQGNALLVNDTEEAAAEARRAGGVEGLDPGTRKHLESMWRMQARSKLAKRLSAADMLRDEGNDKFSAGEYEKALEEYEVRSH